MIICWQYVWQFDDLMIWWSDGGSHIFLVNSSAGFQRWVTWLQGEMASHTHTSPPHPWEKIAKSECTLTQKVLRAKSQKRSHLFHQESGVKSRGSGRGFGGWIAPPDATGNGECVSLLWVLLLLLNLLLLSDWRVPDTRPDPIIFGNTQSVHNFFSESLGISGIGYFRN